MTLSKQRFGAQLYCYYDSVGFLNLTPQGQDFYLFFFYTVKASKLLPLEINIGQLLTKILWNASFIQTAANILLNVQTEIALISRAGLQCRNLHVCRLGV